MCTLDEIKFISIDDADDDDDVVVGFKRDCTHM